LVPSYFRKQKNNLAKNSQILCFLFGREYLFLVFPRRNIILLDEDYFFFVFYTFFFQKLIYHFLQFSTNFKIKKTTHPKTPENLLIWLTKLGQLLKILSRTLEKTVTRPL
jgi:hypothetical protein